MLRFTKQIVVSAIMRFVCNLSNVNSLKCVSMSNQECKIRPEIVKVNSYAPKFYPLSVKINKYSASWNNIIDPYSKMYIPDFVENIII